jgi:endogenous inhibitor of DNA gyrase (YacG/DUF329 family)
MAEKKMRKCCVDFQEYTYCPRCGKDNPYETWRFSFCSKNCKDIYNVLSAYNDGRITADEAKTQLNGLDLSRINDFGEGYKSTINRINSVTSTATDDALEADGADSESTEETITEAKKKNYRKSKKKTDTDAE